MKKVSLSERHTLGVIVCYNNQKRPPFSEGGYFKQLAEEGKKLGIHLIVFNPKEVDWKTRTVSSWFISDDGHWANAVRVLPSLIYDRCYYVDSRHYMSYKPYVLRIAQDPNIRLLGRALGGKLQTYDILKQSPDIQPFLPITIKYHSLQDIIHFIQTYSSALIKPNGGSHGRGVIAISKHAKGFFLRGRSKSNQPFQKIIQSEEQLKTWIKQFIGETRYIVQPYLSLSTPDHRPFDLRILVQKNEKKQWQTTGIAVRTGQPNSITSNLHGGGQATTLQPFLNQNYAKHLVPLILNDIQMISSLVPPFIEKHHGPLVELGLDVGIDRQGNVWLLEVNSKPGRTVFTKTGELDIRQRAVQLPMRYAHALLMGT